MYRSSLLLLLLPPFAHAVAPPRTVSFDRDVRPLLEQHCLGCHGSAPKGGIDLRSLAAMLADGRSGPTVVPGHPGKSPLLLQVADGRMPPGKKPKLSVAQVQVLRAWIGGMQRDASRESFWSFQPPRRLPVPRVRATDRLRTPVDAFLLARLESRSLSLAPDAPRNTLVRRVTFDLTGLPPTPEEVTDFERDARPDAYSRLVERLLASPAFGERWGRHWLDAAGYADTIGPDNDAEIVRPRDGLWRYRDWVIAALNAGLPHDTFLLEQLAGDERRDWRGVDRFTPEVTSSLVATGFLRTAIDNTLENELNLPLLRWQVLHDTLENVSSNLLGLTIGCARCHDHKFDPLPQTDYYRLLACFTPAYDPSAWVQPQNRHLDAIAPREKARIEARRAQIEARLGPLLAPIEKALFEERLASLPAVLRADLRSALATPPAKRDAVRSYLATKLGPLVAVSRLECEKRLVTPVAKELLRERAELEGRLRGAGKLQALFETAPPPRTFLFRRGEHDKPAAEVRPGFPTMLHAPDVAIRPSERSSGRRLALATWLTRPGHPLTGRVFVNRVWQHLFGEGLVATPDNLGRSGARPTHPDLLDWLAVEFVTSGWDVKRLIRLLVSSTAYRQASSVSPERLAVLDAIDPANLLLGRMRLKRLEAEPLRDGILSVAGRLDRRMGGAPVPITIRKDGKVTAASNRRSLYLMSRRNYQPTLLSLFDQPVLATNCVRRTNSAVPLQALALLNDEWMVEQAGHLADRLLASAKTTGERIRLGFLLVLAREPGAEERARAEGLLGRQVQRYLAAGSPAAEAERRAWEQLGQMLTCSNEFLYVE